jgi:hypothetical protein
MKSIFSTLLFAALLVFSACNQTESANGDSANSENSDGLRSSSEVMGTTPTPNANAGGVMHYICAKNCAGSGGPSAGTCPVCGAEYIHNDAFHAQDAAAEQPQITLGDQNNVNAATPPPPAEPAQNANGVWHYTCASGCAGGGGAPGSCASCGGALQHNDAYHM